VIENARRMKQIHAALSAGLGAPGTPFMAFDFLNGSAVGQPGQLKPSLVATQFPHHHPMPTTHTGHHHAAANGNGNGSAAAGNGMSVASNRFSPRGILNGGGQQNGGGLIGVSHGTTNGNGTNNSNNNGPSPLNLAAQLASQQQSLAETLQQRAFLMNGAGAGGGGGGAGRPILGSSIDEVEKGKQLGKY
jgi:hypothetical protein